jgi:hypothetical protein
MTELMEYLTTGHPVLRLKRRQTESMAIPQGHFFRKESRLKRIELDTLTTVAK